MNPIGHEYCILAPENYDDRQSDHVPPCSCEIIGFSGWTWGGFLKKAGVLLVTAFVLAVLLYFVMPRCVDEPRLTMLLYSSISILLTSLVMLGISYYKLNLEREQDRSNLMQMESSVAMEIARRKAAARERNNFCHLIVTMKLEKTYTERENTKLWREVENLRTKLCALETCVERMPDSATTDEEDSDEENRADSNCCIICMERERNTVTSPCRHLCLCSSCARKVTHCPLCRRRIKKQIKVFTG